MAMNGRGCRGGLGWLVDEWYRNSNASQQAYSAIIVQTAKSSTIQQFREAPSCYIFFVHGLIKAFIDTRNAAINLGRIFDKLKNYFWNTPEQLAKMPPQLRQDSQNKVNLETEHMALFFHHIMKENAIYKIMKSAQQTLEDDKATLLEYKIFVNVIDMYKKIYAYCKACFNRALIKQKINPKDGKKSRAPCTNKNCKNCHPQQKACKEDEVKVIDETDENSSKSKYCAKT
jgi:hypothetical protein